GRQVDAVTLEYRRHGDTKLAADRGAYRRAFRRLRAKHAALYADRARLARESRLGPLGRLWYRAWRGARPVPARLEPALHPARLSDRTHTSPAAVAVAATGYAGGVGYVEWRSVADGDRARADPRAPVPSARATLKRLGLAS